MINHAFNTWRGIFFRLNLCQWHTDRPTDTHHRPSPRLSAHWQKYKHVQRPASGGYQFYEKAPTEIPSIRQFQLIFLSIAAAIGWYKSRYYQPTECRAFAAVVDEKRVLLFFVYYFFKVIKRIFRKNHVNTIYIKCFIKCIK